MATSESRRRKQLEKKKKKRDVKRHELTLKRNMSHSEKVLLRAKAPLMECFMTDTLESDGIGYVIISRRVSAGEILVANFVVDRYCLGVKNCFAGFITLTRYRGMFDDLKERDMNFIRIDAPSARRFLEDAVAFAARFDLKPHPDYRSAKLIFGDIDASAGQQLVEMGKDGKPFYISGPFESESDSFEILRKLNMAGQSGSNYITQIPESTAIRLLGQSDRDGLFLESEDEDDDPSESEVEDDSSEFRRESA